MAQNGDNVIPLHPSQDIVDGESPLSVQELTEVVDAIGCCLAEIRSEPQAGASFGKVGNTPLLLQMNTIEQQLEKLAEIKVTTWPDVRWALHFCNARIRALAHIRASATSLETARNCGRSQGTWEQDTGSVEIGAMSRALQGVRDLIVNRYPQTRQAC